MAISGAPLRRISPVTTSTGVDDTSTMTVELGCGRGSRCRRGRSSRCRRGRSSRCRRGRGGRCRRGRSRRPCFQLTDGDRRGVEPSPLAPARREEARAREDALAPSLALPLLERELDATVVETHCGDPHLRAAVVRHRDASAEGDYTHEERQDERPRARSQHRHGPIPPTPPVNPYRAPGRSRAGAQASRDGYGHHIWDAMYGICRPPRRRGDTEHGIDDAEIARLREVGAIAWAAPGGSRPARPRLTARGSRGRGRPAPRCT